MARSTGRLSIFAGTGALAPLAVQAALAAGYKVQVLSLTPREDVTDVKVIAADVANPLAIIWALKVFRTTHIVMAGAIHLPDKAREGLIRFANKDVPSSGNAAPVGDATLAALGSVLKKMSGADLVGIHEIAPDLLAPETTIAGPDLVDADLAFARFALRTARAIGALDIGQAAVVSGHRIIAVEDIGGTDALIARIGELKRQGLAGDGAARLILAKAIKPQQPSFADLPAIGPQTVINCTTAGITAIAVEAGRSLLLQRAELLDTANRLGISVVGLRLADE
ncbi:UDP-2,3-diacylglucosamine diphosphatase LpxI domain-containing protein [uncultured Devosia sp.]|uniref:UDP-2,3-diacylglucosamine diphosphatase LpxI domain-containing protein n=1 Tax=uncultured Devosia sp. TaxID=211434 RepID=UPI0035CB2B1B